MNTITLRTNPARDTHLQLADDEHRPGSAPSQTPTHEDIARCAYGLYLDSGCEQGRCASNWQHAESQLRNDATRQAAPDAPSITPRAQSAAHTNGSAAAVGDPDRSARSGRDPLHR